MIPATYILATACLWTFVLCVTPIFRYHAELRRYRAYLTSYGWLTPATRTTIQTLWDKRRFDPFKARAMDEEQESPRPTRTEVWRTDEMLKRAEASIASFDPEADLKARAERFEAEMLEREMSSNDRVISIRRSLAASMTTDRIRASTVVDLRKPVRRKGDSQIGQHMAAEFDYSRPHRL